MRKNRPRPILPAPTVRYVARQRGLLWCVIDTVHPTVPLKTMVHRFAAEQRARELNNDAAARLAGEQARAQQGRWKRAKAKVRKAAVMP